MQPSTFSIVAYDPEADELGIAVASKFLAVGAVVPFATAGVGAIATQSHANTTFGPIGLTFLEQGYSARETLDALVAGDSLRAQRQVGIVDARGGSASFTGDECLDWAGGRTGEGYAAQGNILHGEAVVEALAATFEETGGFLADRLLRALRAGQAHGGDRRGQQSAALLVVKPSGGYAGLNDRFIDLRVDDHPDPIEELFRLLAVHKLYFFPTREEDLLPVDAEREAQILNILRHAGRLSASPIEAVYDDSAAEALETLFGIENLEDRWIDHRKLDRIAFEYLAEKYSS